GDGVVAVEEDDVVGDKKSESCGIEIREPAELVLDAGGKPVRGDIAVRDAAGTRQRRSLVVRDVDGDRVMNDRSVEHEVVVGADLVELSAHGGVEQLDAVIAGAQLTSCSPGAVRLGRRGGA